MSSWGRGWGWHSGEEGDSSAAWWWSGWEASGGAGWWSSGGGGQSSREGWPSGAKPGGQSGSASSGGGPAADTAAQYFEPEGMPPGYTQRVLAPIGQRKMVSQASPSKQGQAVNRRNFANLVRRRFWRDAATAAETGNIFTPHEWVVQNCS